MFQIHKDNMTYFDFVIRIRQGYHYCQDNRFLTSQKQQDLI